MKKIIKNCKKTFSNGVTVVNCTPHAINFLDGEKLVVVQSSVPEGEKTGPLVVNATAKETEIKPFVVATEFVGNPEGEAILTAIYEELGTDKVFAITSIIAMNAYPGKAFGMCPAPGFERVPPQEKRMSVNKFNAAK